MKKKKIILLLPIKIRDYDFKRYDLYEFQKKGFEIEAHELIEYIYPGFSEIFTKKFSSEKIKKFNSFTIWKNNILEQKKKFKENLLIINQIQNTSFKSIRISFFLKKNQFKTMNFSYKSHPANAKLSLYKKIHWLIKNLFTNKKKIFIYFEQKISSFLYKFLNLESVYLLVFNKNNYNKITKKKLPIILLGNNRDYNFYLKNKNLNLEYDGDYGLFLDSPTPAHNIGDSFITGDKKTLRGTKKNWLKSVNEFFDFIEDKLKIKILIAPHPKIEYPSGNLEIYNNRKVANSDLVRSSKNAKLIISRDSTGTSFAAIYKIPAVFIFTNELKNLNSNFLEHQRKFANEFGLVPLNINEEISDEKLKEVIKFDHESYQNYIRKYCSARDDAKINFEVISEIF